MARVEIPIVVQDGNGNAVAGASITIVNRDTAAPPTVYQAATGVATRSLPLTTGSNGRPPSSWVDRGSYTLTATATAVGTEAYAWDAAPAGDQDIDGAWLDAAGVQAKVWANPSLARGTLHPLVTDLPSSPGDGDEVYYLVDAPNGIIRHLRYRAAVPGWEVIGGGETAWTDIPLNTTYWQNYGAGYESLRCKKTGGIVFIQGLVKSVAAYAFTVPTTLRVGTLPEGFLPPGAVLGLWRQRVSSGAAHLYRSTVLTNGDLLISVELFAGTSTTNTGIVTAGGFHLIPFEAA